MGSPTKSISYPYPTSCNCYLCSIPNNSIPDLSKHAAWLGKGDSQRAHSPSIHTSIYILKMGDIYLGTPGLKSPISPLQQTSEDPHIHQARNVRKRPLSPLTLGQCALPASPSKVPSTCWGHMARYGNSQWMCGIWQPKTPAACTAATLGCSSSQRFVQAKRPSVFCEPYIAVNWNLLHNNFLCKIALKFAVLCDYPVTSSCLAYHMNW